MQLDEFCNLFNDTRLFDVEVRNIRRIAGLRLVGRGSLCDNAEPATERTDGLEPLLLKMRPALDATRGEVTLVPQYSYSTGTTENAVEILIINTNRIPQINFFHKITRLS